MPLSDWNPFSRKQQPGPSIGLIDGIATTKAMTVNHWTFWILLLLFGTLAVIIIVRLLLCYARCQKQRSKKKSSRCRHGKKKRHCDKCCDRDDSSSSGVVSSASSSSSSSKSRRSYRSSSDNSNGAETLTDSGWLLIHFWVFVVIGLLTGFEWWEGVVFILVWEVWEWLLSHPLPREFYETPRKVVLDLIISSIGYWLGLLLRLTICWFPVAYACSTVPRWLT